MTGCAAEWSEFMLDREHVVERVARDDAAVGGLSLQFSGKRAAIVGVESLSK
jgi:hypothetical protein